MALWCKAQVAFSSWGKCDRHLKSYSLWIMFENLSDVLDFLGMAVVLCRRIIQEILPNFLRFNSESEPMKTSNI